MNREDLKKYSVIVNGGSGCLFQPMTAAYTYILTAKHLFFEEKDEGRGIEKVQFADGTNIEIKRFIQNSSGWNEETIPFTLIESETYFPHITADIAILKIEPKIEGFCKICRCDCFENENNFFLCGCPNTFRQNALGDRYSSFNIESFIGAGNNGYLGQLDPTLNQINIAGFSGGGILKIVNDNIYIAGIQSEMANATNYQAGQIAFVPINRFNEIVGYSDYEGKLSKLYPPHMSKFEFLLDDCFNLEVDLIDEHKIAGAKTFLRNKAYAVTKSDVTPIGIKELFKERMLVNETESSFLNHKIVWIAWLEFLTIMNLMKYKEITSEILSDIFNSYRLKHSNVDDWTGIFSSDLLKSDYIGLKENATVIVNTKKTPQKTFFIPKGKMPATIARVYDKRGFKADQGIDPYTSFNFVHIDYFKSKIAKNPDQYSNLLEPELFQKIRSEYHELFN